METNLTYFSNVTVHPTISVLGYQKSLTLVLQRRPMEISAL